MPDTDRIWVRSDLTPFGTYITTVSPEPDTVITLDRDRAAAYATTVLTAVAYAEYDDAVYRQMLAAGITGHDVTRALLGLRADRPPLNDTATAPLRFVPVFGMRTKAPLVHVYLHGRALSEWTPRDATGHANAVWLAAAVVDLDAAYHRFLRGDGLNDQDARAVVGDLADYRGVEETSDGV